MKKILLPTDFSKNTDNAIAYATALFKNEPCEFYVLHAYHSAPSAPVNKQIMQAHLDETISLLNKKNESKNHTFEGVLITDSVVNAINKTFIDKGIDYVVMGTQGSSALKELFLGSNTLSVIQYLDRCPVIVVPTAYDYQVPEEIVLATDFKHAFVGPELQPFMKFAQLWNSKVSVLHIATEAVLSDAQLSNKTNLKNILDRTDHEFLTIGKRDTLADTLLSFKKEERHIALFTMMRTKHGFFNKIFREPVIKKMAFQTAIPFMVLPLFD